MKARYENYQQWRTIITNEAGITLTPDYCRERIDALRNDQASSTKALINTYGQEHRKQIITWFEQAMTEA